VVAGNHVRVVNDQVSAADNHVVAYDIDAAVIEEHVPPRLDIGPLRHDDPGLSGQGQGRVEQRLAMAVAVEVQAVEVGPVALEDHQRAVVVPAPQLADLVAPLVDDAELVFLLCVGRDVEVDLDVQILLRGGFSRGGGAVPGTAEFRHLGNVPRRGAGPHHADLRGQHERRAEKQQRHTRQYRPGASHPLTP
jgi:hypothetical protein